MLDKKLVRTRYSNGLKITGESFEKSEVYLENKLKILALGGLGYGVLLGYKESLALSFEGNLLVVKRGAAIDKYGNLIYVPSAETVRENIHIKEFLDKKDVYVYIKYEEKEGGFKDHFTKKGEVIPTEFISSYEIKIDSYEHGSDTDSEWIELGRVLINYNKGEDIVVPYNPFSPKDNEIDVRYVPKIVTNLIDLSKKDNDEIYRILGIFSDYLNEISFKYRLLSASVASSFVYQVREDIYMNIVTPYDVYTKLKESFRIVGKIEEENPNIKKSDFWKNFNQLKELFSEGFIEQDKKISFYKFDISDQSYLGRILAHFERAGKDIQKLELEVKEEEIEVETEHKGYVQVGRSAKEEDGNDIYEYFVDDKSVSRKHLKVIFKEGAFWIEDLNSKYGTRINDEKMEKGARRLINPNKQTVTLGLQGAELKFNNQKIQELKTI